MKTKLTYGFWYCNVCGAQNHETDAECQYEMKACNKLIAHGYITLRCGRLKGHDGYCVPKNRPSR